MKIKPLTWVIVACIFIILPPLIILFITRFIYEPPASWGWLVGCIVIQTVIALIIGVVIVMIKMSKHDDKPKGINKEDAFKRSQEYVLWHKTNPDNFIINGEIPLNVGESGSERTPLVYFFGRGSESNLRIDFIVNLEDSTKKKLVCSYLVGKEKNEVQEAINSMAKNPATEIKEEKITTPDEFGRPITKITTKRLTEQQKKEEEEKKQDELKNAI